MSDWSIIAEAERNAWRSLEKVKENESGKGTESVDGLDSKVMLDIPGPFLVESESNNLRGDE